MVSLKKCFLLIGVCVLLVATFAVEAVAYDYEPLPGVLSPEEVDLGGQTVTIVTRGDLETEFAPGTLGEGRLEEAEELFNVNFEQVDLGRDRDGEGLLTRIMAGDSTMDIIRIGTHSGYLQTLGQGGFFPIDELLPAEYFDALNPMDGRIVRGVSEYQGHLYSLGGQYLDGQLLTSGYGLTANVDLLEREGMPDVMELYQNYEWDYDTFEDIISQVTRDTTGDGEIDQWGVSYLNDYHRAEQFGYSNDAHPVQQIDGKWTFTYNREEATTVLDKLYEWEEYQVGDSWQYRAFSSDEANEGQVAFMFHDITSGFGRKADDRIDFDVIFVPMPMGPHADDYRTNISNVGLSLLPTNAEQPDELIAIHNFLWRSADEWDDTEFLATYQPDRESFEVLKHISDLWEGESALFRYAVPEEFEEAVFEVLDGERSARAAMGAIEPTVQSFLDDFFGQ